MNSSVQSMIHRVLEKYLKHAGSLCLACSLLGQRIRNPNSFEIRAVQVMKILLTEVSDIPNRLLSETVSNPLLSRISVKVISSLKLSTRFAPLFGV